MADSTPDLYDVEKALLHAGQMRLLPNPLVRAQADIGDKLAGHMARHFATAAEREAAGLALMLAAASIQGLCADGELPMVTVPNIVAIAGQRLVGDARADRAEVSGG